MDLGPLFIYESGAFLTREKLTRKTRLLISKGGPDSSEFAGHSFRIGAATTAASPNLPPWLIKVLSCWSSDCFERYIKTPPSALERVPQQLISPLKVGQPLIPSDTNAFCFGKFIHFYVTSSSNKMHYCAQSPSSPPPCGPLSLIYFWHSANFFNPRKIKGIMLFYNGMKIIILDIIILALLFSYLCSIEDDRCCSLSAFLRLILLLRFSALIAFLSFAEMLSNWGRKIAEAISSLVSSK